MAQPLQRAADCSPADDPRGEEDRRVGLAQPGARDKEDLQRYSIATALITRSAAVRFVLSAIYLVQRPPSPTESFGVKTT